MTHSGSLASQFTVHRVVRIHRAGKSAALLIGGIIIPSLLLLGVIDLIAGGSSNPVGSTTGSVLDAKYAKSVGFPRTVQAAKLTTVSTQKGCTDSVESVYEDAGAKSALLAEVVDCKSDQMAAAALAAARKGVTLDKSVQVPRELGSTAFATNSEPPEYIIAWQAGTRLVLTAIDVDVEASSSTTTKDSLKPLTTSQRRTLINAAIQQNSRLN